MRNSNEDQQDQKDQQDQHDENPNGRTRTYRAVSKTIQLQRHAATSTITARLTPESLRVLEQFQQSLEKKHRKHVSRTYALNQMLGGKGFLV